MLGAQHIQFRSKAWRAMSLSWLRNTLIVSQCKPFPLRLLQKGLTWYGGPNWIRQSFRPWQKLLSKPAKLSNIEHSSYGSRNTNVLIPSWNNPIQSLSLVGSLIFQETTTFSPTVIWVWFTLKKVLLESDNVDVCNVVSLNARRKLLGSEDKLVSERYRSKRAISTC